jgi:hypothetical protein
MAMASWPTRTPRDTPSSTAGSRGRADAQHRDVGVRILADQIRVAREPVGKRGADGARAGDHVAVGEKQPSGVKAKPLPSRPCLRLLHLDVRDRGTDALRRRGDGAGIGVEQTSSAAAEVRDRCRLV